MKIGNQSVFPKVIIPTQSYIHEILTPLKDHIVKLYKRINRKLIQLLEVK